MPVVADRDATSEPSCVDRDVDAAAALGVLRRVVEQVGDDLREAHGVAAITSASSGSLTVSWWAPESMSGRVASTALAIT